MIIFDLDDFSSEPKCNVLSRLLELKQILPKLKVTLFTIPMKISIALLQEVQKYDWIQLAVHGYNHDDNYEFAKLDKKEARELLEKFVLPQYYIKGFKAPGWQISLGTMEALREMGYWVAVQNSDNSRLGDPNGPHQPAPLQGLKYYAWREYPEAIHGHTWECCGNGLEALWQKLIALPPEIDFLFIDEYVQTQNFSLRPASSQDDIRLERALGIGSSV